MKKSFALASASLTTILAASSLAAPAYAWNPKGGIVKQVQNQTAGTAISDANDAATAVSAKTGDMLVYTITVSNTAAAAQNGNNDMASVKLSDTLPTGIEMANSPSQRTIDEDLGTIKPGDKVTKTYSVKVTSTTDGDVITNKACFTGDSTAKDNPQNGCDVAIVKVSVPTPVPTPTPTPTPTPKLTPTPVAALPNTGNSALTTSLFIASGTLLGYLVNLARLKQRSSL